MLDLGSVELTMLWASAALGLVHLLIAVLASVANRGMPWAMGPRDEPAVEMGKTGARLERAYKNFLETFPLFAAAVLIEAAVGHGSGLAALGAQLYFWGRVAYLPVYALGVPVVRTLVWTVAFAGIVLVLAASLPGL
ncbi:MAG: MAPEG family protein [Hyphomonadaceae bacterium]|nr:MAPEG family protein [Hyphomonadaceae bacterium]